MVAGCRSSTGNGHPKYPNSPWRGGVTRYFVTRFKGGKRNIPRAPKKRKKKTPPSLKSLFTRARTCLILSVLGRRGRYATIGTNACDDDQGLCVLRNCGLPSADLSSVDIPPGMTVTLFADTHFRGRKIVLKGPMDANKHCFDSDAMEGRFWNDRTRSVIVEGPDHHV
jgi:hypothetical protein